MNLVTCDNSHIYRYAKCIGIDVDKIKDFPKNDRNYKYPIFLQFNLLIPKDLALYIIMCRIKG